SESVRGVAAADAARVDRVPRPRWWDPSRTLQPPYRVHGWARRSRARLLLLHLLRARDAELLRAVAPVLAGDGGVGFLRRRALQTRAVALTRSDWVDWTLIASLFALAQALLALYAR